MTREDAPPPTEAHHRHRSLSVRWAGLGVAIVVFAAMLSLPPPAGLTEPAWRVAAVAVLMAVLWLTEAIPVAATALMPVAAFPLLGIANPSETAAPYADPIIFLFMGGFIIALAIERWGLHRRVALLVLRAFGARPAALVGGFMTASALLSMWVSNTATSVMMLPIGLSVIALIHRKEVAGLPEREDHAFSLSLLLGIAYGASIGGLATLIGTPPNALLAAYMAKTYGFQIGFGRWMLVGVPLSLAMLGLAWLILTRLAFRVGRTRIVGADAVLRREFASLGAMSAAERRVVYVFAATAVAWMVRPVLNELVPALSDAGIAVIAAVVLFILPAGDGKGSRLMNWDWAARLPWGVLVLFGGGLSLASAIQSSGLAEWIGGTLALGRHWPVVAMVLLVTAIVVFLTELTSNTATAAVFLPVVAALAGGIPLNPLVLTVPAALAASCAFMLPVATPPNAIVFSSGHVSVPEMARAGILLNFAAIALIAAVAYSLLVWVFGVAFDAVPDWAASPGR